MMMIPFSTEIQRVERSIDTLINGIEDPIIRSETRRLIASGGKRLRPIFLLLSARCGSVDERCYETAASLELLHTASLVHDDIIDDSSMRRGEDTTVKKYGRERALSIGTVLSLYAIDRISSLAHDKVSDAFTATLSDLCLGEIKQLDERYDFRCSPEDYLEKISKKTASLFSLPCCIGGHLGGAPPEVIDKLQRIGFYIGCSFQILDDIKDILSTPGESGKETGQDIRSGVITLPYLIQMERDPEFSRRISLLSSASPPEDYSWIISALRDSSSIDRCYEMSNTYLDRALEVLSTLEEEETAEGFRYIIGKLYKG